MDHGAALPGTASSVLVSGVRHLDPGPAVFEAMLEGWSRQQRSRFLRVDATIKPRLEVVRRFARFSNQYPWQWTPGELEAFMVSMSVAVSTARSYQNALRLFCEYVTDARYGWRGECLERFGAAPQQVLHEWNSVVHNVDFEGRTSRRPLSYDEVQALFAAADGRVEEIRERRRKGAAAAQRDAVLLKTVYAFGLRRQEARGLDLVDLRSNPKANAFGRVGGLFVRHGKSSRGSAPKRRTVLTVPEFDWIVELIEHYLTEVRPMFVPGEHPAFWMTERRSRISLRSINEAFENARDAAGIDPHRPRAGPALAEALLCHAPGRVRLPGALRPGASRSLLHQHPPRSTPGSPTSTATGCCSGP